MSNRSKTLYIGYTDNIKRRVLDHNSKVIEGFTKRYNVTKLVYYEKFERPFEAEQREHQLKTWHRDWKINLIESVNKEWKDLFSKILKDAETSSAFIFACNDSKKNQR